MHDGSHEGLSGGGAGFFDVVVPALAVVVVAGYLLAAGRGRRAGWPWRRSLCWLGGTVAAAVAVTGPLADAAAHRFDAHAVAHLLLGMVAPLLLVMAAPVTLLLRTLPVPAARQLGRVLSTPPARVLTEPAVAAVLNVGGLWLLYRTGLFASMHTRPLLGLLVELHVLTAGYLFTASLITPDPLPHRRSHGHRAVVLVLALAAHDVLAKTLSPFQPPGSQELRAAWRCPEDDEAPGRTAIA